MSALNLYLENTEATEAFGRSLAAATRDRAGMAAMEGSAVPGTRGGCLYLRGDLGAGKTTLARGLMRGYGYDGAVKSPTYTLVEPYEFSRYNIYHFDLYRLSDPEEVEFLGVADYFDAKNLCLIEWPDNGGSFLPAPDLELDLVVEGSGRRLTLEAGTEKGRDFVKHLMELCRT